MKLMWLASIQRLVRALAKVRTVELLIPFRRGSGLVLGDSWSNDDFVSSRNIIVELASYTSPSMFMDKVYVLPIVPITVFPL